MEVQFTAEIEQLKLGAGDTFHGEGILAITKALLQSGVAYIGGYQGAPVSHLLDVMVQARPYVDTLGVHVEPCSNEASAAAMLGASIHYPLRGAVTWKSIVGTNVAADALSNLASPGVIGGALIVVGEDYGEGASVIQERSTTCRRSSRASPAPASRPDRVAPRTGPRDLRLCAGPGYGRTITTWHRTNSIPSRSPWSSSSSPATASPSSERPTTPRTSPAPSTPS